MLKKNKELTKAFKEHKLEEGWYKYNTTYNTVAIGHFSLGHDGQGVISYYNYGDGNLDKDCESIIERVNFEPDIEEMLEDMLR